MTLLQSERERRPKGWAEFRSICYSNLVTHRRLFSQVAYQFLGLDICPQSAAWPMSYRQKTGFTGRKLVLQVEHWYYQLWHVPNVFVACTQCSLHNAVAHVVSGWWVYGVWWVYMCGGFIFECGRVGMDMTFLSLNCHMHKPAHT